MPNVQKVIKLTQTQYNTLANGGTVGGYTGLDDNYLYLVPDTTVPVVPKISLNNSGNVSYTIEPNKKYVFLSPSLTGLTLTLSNEVAGIVNKYCVFFYVGGGVNNFPLVVNTIGGAPLLWQTTKPGMLSPFTYYQLDIEDNVASLTPLPNKAYVYAKMVNADTSTTLTDGSISLKTAAGNYSLYSCLIVNELNYINVTVPTGYTVSSSSGVKVNSNNATYVSSGKWSYTPTSNEDAAITVYATPVGVTFTGVTVTGGTLNSLSCTRESAYGGADVKNGGTVKYAESLYLTYSVPSGYTATVSSSGFSGGSGSGSYYKVNTTGTCSITITLTASS